MKAVLNVETYLHCSQDLRGTQHGLWPGQGKFVLTGRRRSLRFSRGWGISPRCCPVVFDPSADQRVFDSHSFARRRRVFILRRSDSSAGSGSFSEHTSGDVTSARVLAHAQIVEHQTHVQGEPSHFLCHAPSTFGSEHADGKTTEARDVFRTIASPDATAIFIEVPVQYVMATFDCPVSAVGLQHTFRAGLCSRAAGDAVADVQRKLAGLLVRAVPLDDERLPHIRKIEIRVQLFCRPDLARFDASVIGWGMLDKMGFAPIPELELQGFQKTGLVSFYGEKVMSFALFDQIRSEFTLGQQGVDGDVLALNTDRVQQRDHRLDLIRAFDFVLFLPRYGQGANFFWVWQVLVWGPTTLITFVCV